METLKNYGVREMNTNEMKSVDGGNLWLLLADFITDYLDGLSDGYKDFKNN